MSGARATRRWASSTSDTPLLSLQAVCTVQIKIKIICQVSVTNRNITVTIILGSGWFFNSLFKTLLFGYKSSYCAQPIIFIILDDSELPLLRCRTWSSVTSRCWLPAGLGTTTPLSPEPLPKATEAATTDTTLENTEAKDLMGSAACTSWRTQMYTVITKITNNSYPPPS